MRKWVLVFLLVMISSISYANEMPNAVNSGLKAFNNGDYELAFKQFKTAAEAGDPQGESNLAALYMQGLGVKLDYSKAIYWLKQAIDKNNKIAYNNLAYLYMSGKGVKKNMSKALRLYKKSAALNYVKAQNQLGFIYYQGRTEQQDFEQAYLYFSLAEQNEDATSASMLSVLSKQMTSQQLKQANDLVKNYKFSSTN